MVKLTHEQIKKSIEEIGYKLLSEEYVNAHRKLKVECDKGHIYNPTGNNFKKGARCSHCSGRAKHKIEDIIQEVEKENYKLFSEEYHGVNGDFILMCPHGNIGKTKYRYGRQGFRCNCLECCENKKGHSHKYTHKEVNNIVTHRGFKLKSIYEGSWKKLKMVCPNNHEVNMYFGNFIKGHGCKECAFNLKRSYTENNLTDGIEYSKHCRSLANKNYAKFEKIINPLGYKNGYHVDHIFSIYEGFKNSVLPKIISSPINLQMLTITENIKKHKNSWCTINELFERYKKWESK